MIVDSFGTPIYACPVCDPSADPRVTNVTVCESHTDHSALDNPRVTATGVWNSCSGEWHTETNRAACDFIHRGIMRAERVPVGRQWTNHDMGIEPAVGLS